MARTTGTAVLMALAGAAILAGGVLHPQVPPEPGDQQAAIAASTLWAPAHWLLTLGQAAAVACVAMVAVVAARSALAVAGGAALALGLAFGVLGTLLAATGLRAAAVSGDTAAFAAWGDAAMGVGWLCLLLSAAGAAAWGWDMMRAPWLLPKLGALVLLAGSLLLLVAAAAVPYDHWWTHQYVLRAGALGLGVGLLGLAAAWRARPSAAA
ncbi:MAG: hypothetical protein QOD77_697 [Thermoplasmata archaeon]|jgi:hypothetical protein|nr:hypothetical protein [Thermoplasmata archaeon]